MTLSFKRLSPALGAEVQGLDMTAAWDDATVARLRQAFLEHQLLLVRGQEVSTEDEIRFAELFGPVSRMGGNMQHGGKTMRISNAHEDGAFPTGELLFHSDHCFFKYPLKAIALYGEEVPSRGGDTLFANALSAWENLPPRLKERVSALQADHLHDYGDNSGGKRVDAAKLGEKAVHWVHPIAWPHPDSGATVLLVNRLMTDHVVGLDRAESDRLLEELFAYVEDPRVIYRHVWQKHDLVIWDNRVLQHARTDFDPAEKRVLRRVPIAEHEDAIGPVQR